MNDHENLRFGSRAALLGWAVLAALLVAGCANQDDPTTPDHPGYVTNDTLQTVRNLVLVDDEIRPAAFVASWDPPLSAGTDFAVAAYLVAVGAGGEITAADWAEATVIDTVPHTGGRLTRAYDAGIAGIHAGARLHLAVRPSYAAVDDPATPVLAPPVDLEHAVTDTCWIAGRVIDDAGRPLPGIDVVTLPGLLRNSTDGNGRYRVGPVSDAAIVRLQTESPDTVSAAGADDAWYDCYTEDLAPGAADGPDITLLTRYEIDLGITTRDHFSHYFFQALDRRWDRRPRAWRWDSLPLTVHVPEDTITVRNPDDTWAVTHPHELARAALAHWSQALGAEIFVEVETPGEAQIIFSYRDMETDNREGETGPLVPLTGFWTDPPQVVEVVVNTGLEPLWWTRNAGVVAITFSHEVGHALGHWGHSPNLLDDSGTRIGDLLMLYGAGDRVEPHLWDMRVVRALQNLPQGFPVTNYEQTRQTDGEGAFDGNFPPLD